MSTQVRCDQLNAKCIKISSLSMYNILFIQTPASSAFWPDYSSSRHDLFAKSEVFSSSRDFVFI